MFRSDQKKLVASVVSALALSTQLATSAGAAPPMDTWWDESNPPGAIDHFAIGLDARALAGMLTR